MKLIQIGKTSDLLKCESIATKLKIHSEQEVMVLVMTAISKCIISLGIEMEKETMLVLAEDIIAKFPNESLEDVFECLRRGRRGDFGFGHNNRKHLNMLVISEWMQKLLELKSMEMEKMHQKAKHKEIETPPLTKEKAQQWIDKIKAKLGAAREPQKVKPLNALAVKGQLDKRKFIPHTSKTNCEHDFDNDLGSKLECIHCGALMPKKGLI